MKKIFLSFFILSILVVSVDGFAIQTNTLDSFETNDYFTDDPYNPTNIANNNFGGSWYCSDDSGGSFTTAKHSATTLLEITSNAHEGFKCMHTSYTLGVSDSGAGEWAYWELDSYFSSNEIVRHDLSGQTIDFWIKGAQNLTLKVSLIPPNASTTYADDIYTASFTVTTNWQHIILPVDDSTFQQAGWGNFVPFTTAVTEVLGINFTEDAPEAGNQQFHSFWVDDIKFLVPELLTTLLSPASGSTVDTSSHFVVLHWTNAYTNINLYQIDVSSVNDFSSHISSFPKNLSSTSTVLSISEDGMFFWRVRSSTNNGSSWGDWSSISGFRALDSTLTYILDDFESYSSSLSGWAVDSAGLPDAWMGNSLGTNSDLNASQFMNVGFYCANDSTGWMESTRSMPSSVYGYRQLSFWVKPSKVGMQFSLGYSITNRAYHYNDNDSSTGEGPGGTNDFLYQYLYTYIATSTNWEHVTIPHSKLALQSWFLEEGYPNAPIDYSKIESFYLTSGYVDSPHTNWAQFDNIQLEAGTPPNVKIEDFGSIASGVLPISVSASYSAGLSKVVAIVSNTQNHSTITANMTAEVGGKFTYNYDASSLSSGNIIVTVKVYDNDAGISTVTKVYSVGYVSDKDIGKVIIHNNLLNFKDDPNAAATIFYKSKVDMDYNSPALAKLDIYSVSGQLIFEHNIAIPVSGILSYEWDGKNGYGDPVGAGIYLVKVQVGNEKKISRILIIR